MTLEADTIYWKHQVNLSLPFPSTLLAQHVISVLTVDRELRPKDVVKSFTVEDLEEKEKEKSQDQSENANGNRNANGNGSSKGALLNINIKGTTLRHIRISTNALLEDLALIIRTMDQFLPDSLKQEQDSSSTSLNEEKLKGLKLEEGGREEEEEEFEQGKVGLAG